MAGKICTLVLGLFIFTSCSNVLKNTRQDELTTEQLNLNTGNAAETKIVFLNYEVSIKDSIKDTYSFQLIKSTIVKGALKNTLSTEKAPFDPTYLYVLFNEKEKGKQYLKVHDPLKMTFEYPGDNTSLEKRMFTNKKGETTIRFQHRENLQTISIFKVQPITLQLKKVYHATL